MHRTAARRCSHRKQTLSGLQLTCCAKGFNRWLLEDYVSNVFNRNATPAISKREPINGKDKVWNFRLYCLRHQIKCVLLFENDFESSSNCDMITKSQLRFGFDWKEIVQFQNNLCPNVSRLEIRLDCKILPWATFTNLETAKIEGQTRNPFFKFKSDSCLLYTSPSPRDKRQSRMPSSA